VHAFPAISLRQYRLVVLLGCLDSVRDARQAWPEGYLAFIATALPTALRLSDLLGLDLGSMP
jgi:hypothetical protein